MRIRTAALAGALGFLTLAAAPNAREALHHAPESVYVKVDYMQLAESTPQTYFALELGEWRPIHAQRIRRGVTTAWRFYEMMPGARMDGDQAYDYITVSGFDDYDKIFGDGPTEAIFDVYPGARLPEMYARADRARSFVRSDIWRVVDVWMTDAPRMPSAEYAVVDFHAAPDGLDAALETARRVWGASHAERIQRGVLKAAALLVLKNPEEETRPYAYATVLHYDALKDALAPMDANLARAAHPDMDGAEAEARAKDAAGARGVFKSQLWRRIDGIDAEDLDAE